jgi:hypothetical protein
MCFIISPYIFSICLLVPWLVLFGVAAQTHTVFLKQDRPVMGLNGVGDTAADSLVSPWGETLPQSVATRVLLVLYLFNALL